jgi:hypothetical protein
MLPVGNLGLCVSLLLLDVPDHLIQANFPRVVDRKKGLAPADSGSNLARSCLRVIGNATDMSVSEVIELYSLRWHIELFFKVLKSTLHAGHYQFEQFQAVEGWMNCVLTTVLYLEHLRAKRLADRRLSAKQRSWWQSQRLHGLREAFIQQCQGHELKQDITMQLQNWCVGLVFQQLTRSWKLYWL